MAGHLAPPFRRENQYPNHAPLNKVRRLRVCAVNDQMLYDSGHNLEEIPKLQ
jgi:hypothetical protein